MKLPLITRRRVPSVPDRYVVFTVLSIDTLEGFATGVCAESRRVFSVRLKELMALSDEEKAQWEETGFCPQEPFDLGPPIYLPITDHPNQNQK